MNAWDLAEALKWADNFGPTEGEAPSGNSMALESLAKNVRNYQAKIADLESRLEAVEKDAERYRWLRSQYWDNNVIAAVMRPKDAVRLGHDCPSRERLDTFIDEAMKESQP